MSVQPYEGFIAPWASLPTAALLRLLQGLLGEELGIIPSLSVLAVSTLDLQPAYRQNQDVSKFVRQTVALAFVPRKFICLAWDAIKVTAPAVDKMNEFVAYFEETWLEGNFGPRI